MLTTTDLKAIDGLVSKQLSKQLGPFRKSVSELQEDVSQIRKDIKVIVNFFDREYLDLRKRVKRIEQHLGLPPL